MARVTTNNMQAKLFTLMKCCHAYLFLLLLLFSFLLETRQKYGKQLMCEV